MQLPTIDEEQPEQTGDRKQTSDRKQTEDRRLRILVISQFFSPDITAAAFRITDFVEQLANYHDVKVLTSHPHKAIANRQDSQTDDDATFAIYRCHVASVKGSGAKAYLRHYLSFVTGSIWNGMKLWLRGWRPDVIYASSPPLLIGLSARFFSLLYRRPMVFEIRDIWPDTAVAAGQLSADGRAYRLGRTLERYLYRKASQLVCVSAPMKEYLETQCSTPTTVIYNGVPSSAIEATNVESVRPEVNHRTLMYAGNIGHLQELDLLVAGFAELQREVAHADWHVRIVGAGAQRNELEDQVRELGCEQWFEILPAISREEALAEMCRADALYLNLKKHPVLERTIPSKLFDYLLAGKPIVAGLGGEGKRILEQTKANVCFEPGELSSVKKACSYLIDEYQRLRENSHKNRALVLERFTREEAAKTLLLVLRSTANGSRAVRSKNHADSCVE